MKETLLLKQQVLDRQLQLLQEKVRRLEVQISQISEKKQRLQFEVTKLKSLETKKKQTATTPEVQEPDIKIRSLLIEEDNDWI